MKSVNVYLLHRITLNTLYRLLVMMILKNLKSDTNLLKYFISLGMYFMTIFWHKVLEKFDAVNNERKSVNIDLDGC